MRRGEIEMFFVSSPGLEIDDRLAVPGGKPAAASVRG